MKLELLAQSHNKAGNLSIYGEWWKLNATENFGLLSDFDSEKMFSEICTCVERDLCAVNEGIFLLPCPKVQTQ